MSYIAGIDIGNSTTEVCVGEVGAAGTVHFLTSASCPTTGTKGTPANVHGIKAALKQAMAQIGQEIDALSCIRLNEAAPVIGDTAMETLTETIITDSSMIGHNPSTPAGAGQAVGKILLLEDSPVPSAAFHISLPHPLHIHMKKSQQRSTPCPMKSPLPA